MPSPHAAELRQNARRDFDERPRPRTTQNTPTRNPGFAALKQSNLSNAASLKDRVSKWQTSASDPNSEDESGDARPRHYSPELRRPRLPVQRDLDSANIRHKKATDLDRLEHSPVRRHAMQTKVDADVRAASMPKKRLVSDEHWKKTRSPAKEFPNDSRIVLPKPGPTAKALDAVVLARPVSNGCDAWVRPKTSPIKTSRTREGKQDTKRQAQGHADINRTRQTHKAKTTEDLQEREQPKPSQRSSAHQKAKSAGDLEVGKSHSEPEDGKGPLKEFPRSRPKEQQSPNAMAQPGINKSFKPALEFFAGQMPPGGHAKFLRDAAQRKDEPRETPLPTRSLKIQPQQVAGGLVDNWLGSTPDPFVEDYRTLGKGAKAAPSLQDLKNNLRPTRSREAVSDESPRRHRDTGRDSAHRRPRPEPEEPDILPDFDHRHLPSTGEVDVSSDHSPRRHTLKRSGAKRNDSTSKPKDALNIADRLDTQQPSPPSTVFSAPDTVRPDESASVVVPQETPRYVRALEYTKRGNGQRPYRNADHVTASQSPPSQALVPSDQDRQLAEDPLPRPNDREATNDMTLHQRPSLKRKLTSHADLMSVLSEPVAANQPLKSACSIRSTRTKPGSTSFAELVVELRSDEVKYMRELRTLIDGVVPVLLSCVLSQEHAPAAGLPGQRDMSSITTPIVNMGVVLERLRSCHKRLSTDHADTLVAWTSHAHNIYADYIKVWRMGFQDVVVDLAPASEDRQNGYGGHGTNQNEKVDVSFLLKRPLVRIRHLVKTLQVLASIDGSRQTHVWAEKYQDLVAAARDRQSEERARLEDEAAASIDVTRVRDPITLAPLAGVQINPSHCVKARDIFDMRLHHSTGQRLDCRVELIIRDSNGSSTGAGDVLICEIESSARWLLMPPVQLESMSARPGIGQGEIVVMIRGEVPNGQLWCELLCLQGEDKDAGVEWLSMLPARPIPPEIVVARPPVMPVGDRPKTELHLGKSTSASSNEIDVPIGEQASVISQRWDALNDMPMKPGRSSRPVSMPAGMETSKQPLDHGRSPFSARYHKRDESRTKDAEVIRDLRNHYTSAGSPEPCAPRDPDARTSANVHTAPSTPARANGDYDRMATYARHEELSTASGSRLSAEPSKSASTVSKTGRGFSVWLPQQEMAVADGCGPEPYEKHVHTPRFVSRSRSPSPEAMSRSQKLPSTPTRGSTESLTVRRKEVPSSPVKSVSPSQKKDNGQPSTPQQSPPQLRGASTPVFTPPSSGPRAHRRSSSPLKHEYAPSTSSDDSPDARDLLDDDDAESISSASSADDIVPSLPPAGLFNRGKRQIEGDRLSGSPTTLGPPHSASQVLYRDDPAESAVSDRKIASIFCWSDKGTWESLHPDECSIIVTAGLIEAFTMSSVHSGTAKSTLPSPASPFYSPRPEGVAPLIGLELTPQVPLRRSTAIDISIRSPPTPISVLKVSTRNIMFRSRNNIECEHLYNAINHARINNPRYIALQNACPGVSSNYAAYMDGRTSQADRPSWWRLGRRRSSYRASSTRRTSSVAGVTDASSVATMSSAISALKRFSANSRMFNVAKSTVTSHGNLARHTRSSTTFSSDSGSGSGSGSGAGRIPSGASTPPAGVGVGLDPSLGTSFGIRDNKIRLYAREGAGRWRDMGSARLTIMQPPRPAGAPPPLGPDGRLRQEKRVLILGKTKGETLLDVTAGEGSFERVARTGIAMSVWERLGEVGKSGGVAGVRVNVYMVQMKSEAEAAYTFSLVGRLRC